MYHSGQEFPKLGEKSSASARKWVNLHRHQDVASCYNALRERGFRIYTTHMSSDAVSLYDLDLTQPVALVFGNEHHGVSAEARHGADGNFLIPQVGVVQSLNISVACAVSLYEAFRQRFARGLYSEPQYSPEELARFREDWFSR